MLIVNTLKPARPTVWEMVRIAQFQREESDWHPCRRGVVEEQDDHFLYAHRGGLCYQKWTVILEGPADAIDVWDGQNAYVLDHETLQPGFTSFDIWGDSEDQTQVRFRPKRYI